MANHKIPDIGVHHLALLTADFNQSIKFYTEGLGFKVIIEWGEGPKRAAMLDIGNGSHFEIFACETLEEEKNARFTHFAFATSNVDLAYENAIKAGAVPRNEPKSLEIPSNPPVPIRIAFVLGPDGEVLEFFQML